MKNKSKSLIIEEIEERQKFLDIYHNFNEFLYSLGFRVASIKESMRPEDNCIFETNQFKSSHGVERYIHDILNLSVRFCRNHYKHEFVIVGNWNHFSEIIDIEIFKNHIKDWVIQTHSKKLNELNSINYESLIS